MPQSLPRSAEAYGAQQRAEIGAAVKAALRHWRRMGPEFDTSYALIEPSLLRIADLAQSRVAEGAQRYIPDVLAETGQRRAAAAAMAVDALSLVGTAGDGLPTEGLLYGAVTHAKVRVGAGATVGEALASGSRWLSTGLGTLLSDTGRASETLAMQARPAVTGWVRMLEPPSCGRCVVLAGKPSRRSDAFLRHPKCDCRNIPTSESIAGDFTVNARAHFDSLDEAGQVRLMGSKANAAAVRDHDADINQIINAYRGGSVRSAQVYDRSIKYTTEGTTKRGLAYKQMSQADYLKAAGEAKRGRNVALKAPRLMPESIAQIATGPADEARLLRLYGWLL